MSQDTPDGRERVVFISHRHADERIAHVIRRSIEDWAAGEVKVFQSSYPENAPRVGRHLAEELKRQLYEANVVFLLFTTEDQNWSYCMWECGLAIDPRYEDTNVIVLQVSGAFPEPLGHLVRVDAKSETDLHKLVQEFFTEPEFFPGSDGALRPRVRPADDHLKDKALKLRDELEEVAPPPQLEEWPAWPYLKLQIAQEEHQKIREAAELGERLRLAKEILTETSIIVDGNRTARYMFGRQRFRPGITFGEVIGDWERKKVGDKELDPPWIESLAGQIMEAASEMTLELKWAPVQGVRDPSNATDWSFPVVQWIRGVDGGFQFDVYFIPVPMGVGGEREGELRTAPPEVAAT